MANYPGSVWSPSAKSAGQTIDASHINDAQDEIVAIESGLTQGTAPLNSSRSTVVALSVTAGSTFGARPVMPPPHMAMVFLETLSDLGSSALSTIAWTAQTILTNSSLHSTGTDPGRITPQSTGIYRGTVQISFSQNSTGIRSVAIRDSSGGDMANVAVYASATNVTRIQATGYKRFDALGSYVQCVVAMSDQTTLSITTGVGVSWFGLEKL